MCCCLPVICVDPSLNLVSTSQRSTTTISCMMRATRRKGLMRLWRGRLAAFHRCFATDRGKYPTDSIVEAVQCTVRTAHRSRAIHSFASACSQPTLTGDCAGAHHVAGQLASHRTRQGGARRAYCPRSECLFTTEPCLFEPRMPCRLQMSSPLLTVDIRILGAGTNRATLTRVGHTRLFATTCAHR